MGGEHCSRPLTPGERLVRMKGLVLGLVEAMGLRKVDAFLGELHAKARRFEEARTHPREGLESRRTRGERAVRPTADEHAHFGGCRDPDRPGGRAAEREREVWARA